MNVNEWCDIFRFLVLTVLKELCLVFTIVQDLSHSNCKDKDSLSLSINKIVRSFKWTVMNVQFVFVNFSEGICLLTTGTFCSTQK